MQRDAGIDAAATRTHRQAVKRRHTHGGINAFTRFHGAQTRAVAQMRSHHPALRQFRMLSRQQMRRPFIRKSMEPVAAYTTVAQMLRQSVMPEYRRMTRMESRIEAADLHRLGVQRL